MTEPKLSEQGIDQSSDQTRDLEKLRGILLGSEFDDLLTLKSKLQTKDQLSLTISSVISEAIDLRMQSDDSIATTLSPSIESALHHSIQSNPKALADVLYPVMGPAIRKSIRETFSQMFDSFNAAIEQSLSIKSLAWRFEAWRSGKLYSDIVLLKTMLFQVEQVFLIQNNSGLLIHHLMSEQSIVKDPKVVSGMLTAIQDFIADSFNTSNEEPLTTMELGDLTVLIEQGPQATIASVVRGKVSPNYRGILIDTLERGHQNFNQLFKRYIGDPEATEELQALLKPCLQSEKQKTTKPTPWFTRTVFLLLTLITSYFTYLTYVKHQAWNDFVQQVNEQPGLIVLKNELNFSKATIIGLADPLSIDPKALLTSELSPIQIDFNWQPYLSLEPELSRLRFINSIDWPSTVRAQLDGDILTLIGSANAEWVTEFKNQFSRSQVITSLNIDDLDIIDTVANRITQLIDQIQTTQFHFPAGSWQPPIEDLPAFLTFYQSLNNFFDLVTQRNESYRLTITGHTDATGDLAFNKNLALSRAQAMSDLLIKTGLNADLIIIGNTLLNDVQPDQILSDDRIVTFALRQTTPTQEVSE